MKELKTAMQLVQDIMEADKLARNSDEHLYLQVLKYYGNVHGVDIDSMSIITFFMHMREYGFPPFETIRRTRQMVQRKYPGLMADKPVYALREERRQKYLAFVRDENYA